MAHYYYFYLPTQHLFHKVTCQAVGAKQRANKGGANFSKTVNGQNLIHHDRQKNPSNITACKNPMINQKKNAFPAHTITTTATTPDLERGL